mgnify:CR=1 FL=1
MDTHDFIARFAGIYEHSPWVAERVATIAEQLDDTEQLAALMVDCVDNADTEKQLALIRAHPDLAGKAQRQDVVLHAAPPQIVERLAVRGLLGERAHGLPIVKPDRGQNRPADCRRGPSWHGR